MYPQLPPSTPTYPSSTPRHVGFCRYEQAERQTTRVGTQLDKYTHHVP